MRLISELKEISILNALILMGCCLCLGCGRGDLGQVSGTVTLDGQPLANALVQFVPTGAGGGVSMGRTDSSGNYYTMLSRTAEGSTLGENQVRITTREILDEGGQQRWVAEKVPNKYNSKTELLADVQAGSNTFDFTLSSAGGTIDRPMQTGSDF